MDLSRRELAIAFVPLLAGCTGNSTDKETTKYDTESNSQSTRNETSTTVPPEELSLTDLRIANLREEYVDITTIIQKEEETTMSLEVDLDHEEVFTVEDCSFFNHPVQIKVRVEDEAGNVNQSELNWDGDTSVDNRGIEIYANQDGVDIGERVA